MNQSLDRAESLAREVRLHIFQEAAATAKVPQPPEIAADLGRPEPDIEKALRHLAAGKVLMRDRVLTTLDAARISARARELALRVWKRFEEGPKP